MKILFDHQAFEMQAYGGISRYHFELLQGLSNSENILPRVSIKRTNNEYLKKIRENILLPGDIQGFSGKKIAPFDPYNPIIPSSIWQIKTFINKVKNRNIREENIKNSIKQLQDGNYDIFHPTYYDPYFCNHLKGHPFVITIHDLIQEKFPEFFPLRDEAIERKMLLIEQADHIIAVSESTKKDIITFYDTPPDDISVVYHGCDHSKASPEVIPENTLQIPKKFFLYVGDRQFHKNFYFMLESISPLLKKLPDYYIVCCGGGQMLEPEKQFFKKLHLSDKIIHVDSSEKTLGYCYNNAIALIYPSLYEGFGIPIIEAFSHKCPVIASNIPTTIEIGENAFSGFEPKDPGSFRQAVNKILSDPSYRETNVLMGKRLSEKFSWDRAVRDTIQVYNRVV